jgi:hypothetical protein
MTYTRRPRAFVSYRHAERTQGPDAEDFNRRHRDWVRKFAADLRGQGVDVVDDVRIRRLVDPLFNGKAETAPFVADITVAALYVCHAFIPVITPGYLERLGYGDYKPQKSFEDGYVFEEFNGACALAQAGQQELVPVLREGALEEIERLPLNFNRRTMFDLRAESSYEDDLERLAERLHLGFHVEKPPVDKELRDWLQEFISKRLEYEKLRGKE